MGKDTEIPWCDDTVNPTTGCDGCELWPGPCYAGHLHEIRLAKSLPKLYAPRFTEVRLAPGRMVKAAAASDLAGWRRSDKPWLGTLPRLIFVSDMADALSAAVPFEYLLHEIILNVTSVRGRRHHWLWLTKRPKRMAQFCRWLADQGVPWPANLWAGTSITTQATTSRIDSLLQVGDAATIRLLSVEPQFESLNLRPWLPDLDWIIQGGLSGCDAHPFDLAWVESLIDQCGSAGVPYFLKQLGSHVVSSGRRLSFRDGHAGDWSEWPAALRVRQMPLIPSRRLSEALGDAVTAKE